MIKKLSAPCLAVLSGQSHAHQTISLDSVSHALTHLSEPAVVLSATLAFAVIGLAVVARRRRLKNNRAGR